MSNLLAQLRGLQTRINSMAARDRAEINRRVADHGRACRRYGLPIENSVRVIEEAIAIVLAPDYWLERDEELRAAVDPVWRAGGRMAFEQYRSPIDP